MLINIGVIFLCDARVPDLKSRLYDPFSHVEKFSFTLVAPGISELVREKTNSKVEIEDKFRITVDKGNIILKFDSGDLRPELKQIISEQIKLKTFFQVGPTLSDWLKDYEFDEEKSGWFTYVDQSGLNDRSEIKVYFLNKILKIKEKTPTGNSLTEYHFKITSWSNNLLVLDHVIKNAFEGAQLTSTETILEYEKVKIYGYVPVKVTMKTKQKLKLEENGNVERDFTETFEYHFRN